MISDLEDEEKEIMGEELGELPLSESEKNTEKKGDVNSLLLQLAEKDKDLVLSAKLGKALLMRNEEIMDQNERIVNEFRNKMQVLEQENFLLRILSEKSCHVCGERLAELQTEVVHLRENISREVECARSVSRSRDQLVSELMEQNMRLSGEVSEREKRELDMKYQMGKLKEDLQMRRSNLEEHFYLVESLRMEAGREEERRSELERDLSSLSCERESLAESLEFSMSRVVSLEQRSVEQDKLLRAKEHQLEEARYTKLQLIEQLESFSIETPPSRQRSRLSRTGCKSLLYEMESLSSSRDEGSPLRRLHSSSDEEEYETFSEDLTFSAKSEAKQHLRSEDGELEEINSRHFSSKINERPLQNFFFRVYQEMCEIVCVSCHGIHDYRGCISLVLALLYSVNYMCVFWSLPVKLS